MFIQAPRRRAGHTRRIIDAIPNPLEGEHWIVCPSLEQAVWMARSVMDIRPDIDAMAKLVELPPAPLLTSLDHSGYQLFELKTLKQYRVELRQK